MRITAILSPDVKNSSAPISRSSVPHKSRREIYIDDEYAFFLYDKEVKQYGLKEGLELSQDEYTFLMRDCVGTRCKKRAMYLLADKDYPIKKLRDKLLEGGYTASVVEDTITYLSGYHYLDDVRYARQYISFRMDTHTRKQMTLKLLQRGLSANDIEKAFEDLSANEDYDGCLQEEKLARELLQKKMRHLSRGEIILMQPKDWNKLYQFLARKGVPSTIINRIISEFRQV